MIRVISLLTRMLSERGHVKSRWVNLLNTIRLHWNISVRGKAWIFHWRPQVRLLINKGNHSLTAQVYFGLSEYMEMSFLIKHLHPGSYFVDVGANMGAYSVLAAGVCKSEVLAVEPWPSNVEVLSKQVELNSLADRVEIMQAGASDQDGVLWFQSDSSQNTYVIKSEMTDSLYNISLPVFRLDTILRRCPHYIKIDVEGHEWQVLMGLGKYLDNPDLKVIQCETIIGDDRSRLEKLWEFMHLKGFVPYKYSPETDQLIEIELGERENTLFVKGG